MRKLGLFIAGLALAGAPLAQAVAQRENWTHIGSAEGEWDVYYDPGRLDRSGSVVKVWLKRDLVRVSEGVSYFISQAEFDCARQTARILYTASYDASGSVLARDPDPVPAEPIPPGSFFDTMQQRIC